MFVAVVIFLLCALIGTLVGQDFFKERNALMSQQIHKALDDRS